MKTIKRVDILGATGAFMVMGIGLDVIPEEHEGGTILAAGPLVKQDKMTAAYRPVLWANCSGDFCIHDQVFPESSDGDYNKSYFHQGQYLGNDFNGAMEEWAGRVEQQTHHCGRLTKTA